MVLVSEELVSACLEFEADIYLLYHDTRLCPGFRTTVHVGNVCQTVQVMTIKDKVGKRFEVNLLLTLLIVEWKSL